jgi:hypothetical protein
VLSYLRPAAAPTPRTGATYIQTPAENGAYIVGQQYQFGPITIQDVENSVAAETIFFYEIEGAPVGMEVDGMVLSSPLAPPIIPLTRRPGWWTCMLARSHPYLPLTLTPTLTLTLKV